mgnify:CR=1 FL=1
MILGQEGYDTSLLTLGYQLQVLFVFKGTSFVSICFSIPIRCGKY